MLLARFTSELGSKGGPTWCPCGDLTNYMERVPDLVYGARDKGLHLEFGEISGPGFRAGRKVTLKKAHTPGRLADLAVIGQIACYSLCCARRSVEARRGAKSKV